MSFVIRVACAWACIAVLVVLPVRAAASNREAFAGTWVWKHGADSHGTTRWRFLEDRNHLVVSQLVHDVHFEQPIEYSTTYRRLEQ